LERTLRGAASSPLTITLSVLAVWIGIRLFPDPAPWGLRKYGELVLFGIPAFIAGYTIARSNDARDAAMRLFAYAGVPISVIVVAQAALGNPYSFSWVGSGGYQLTGIFLAFQSSPPPYCAIPCSSVLRHSAVLSPGTFPGRCSPE
jgi:hypothetical protein